MLCPKDNQSKQVALYNRNETLFNSALRIREILNISSLEILSDMIYIHIKTRKTQQLTLVLNAVGTA